MRPFEGTVLWTGIESLRHRLEKDAPADLRARVAASRRVFTVEGSDGARYANRPRLISTLSAAITDCREIEITEQAADGSLLQHRLQPHRLVIRPPHVELLAYPTAEPATDGPLRLDLSRIQKVTALDATFEPRPEGPA